MWFSLATHKDSPRIVLPRLDADDRKAHFKRMDNTDTPFAAGRREATAISLVRPYAETLVMVAASTLAGMLMAPRWGTSAVDLLYLPGVLAAAGFYGLAPGMVAAVVSALAFNFFFTQPFHTFRITNPEDVATVALLFLVALVTSQLAARMRAQAQAAQGSAARNATIAGLARRLLSCSSDEAIAAIACRELGRLFDCNAVVVDGLPEPQPIAASPRHAILTPSDLVAAAWAITSGQPAGRGAKSVDATEWVFYPLRSGSAVFGAIGLARDDGRRPVASTQGALLDSMVDQVVLAFDRARHEGEAREFARVREGDRLRSVLLSSIGQDIEPRLAAIAGSVRQLRRSDTSDKTLVSAIDSEVSKLQRYLSNLLELGPESDRQPVQASNVTIDLFHRSVAKGGAAVHLSPKEYAVLAELAKHPGRVLTHAHLLRTVWGPAQENQTEYLRVAVRALRQKLEEDPAHPAIIINEPAVGYRLVQES
jgi:two-component system sensor histidine kinase KdpD